LSQELDRRLRIDFDVLEAQQAGREAVVGICDHGEGIAPEHQAKVFERFYRVDKTRFPSEGGAGLGPAIAKLAVERHGGRIELESAPGKGSTFRIRLPVTPFNFSCMVSTQDE